MKSAPSYHNIRDGTALLPALILLGMVTVIVVLFFSMSTMQVRVSSTHAAEHDVAALQDMAINAAIGQMRLGTTENNALWISQPGAIRTYAANNGEASRVYKLYSARDMVVQASALTTASAQNLENDLPPDWNTRTGAFADLNEPAIDEAGGLAFPVVDPRAMDMATPSYPASKTPEGFQYSQNLAVSSAAVHGVRLPGSVASSQRLPMPVRWIYVLQDGSIGVMDDSTPPRFTPFAGQSNASRENPIVGRYAFWTDDESAKININTASEAIFWDTPKCATQREIEFATKPPVRNEVQRFGGHPATTCLSTVFFPGERLVPGTSTVNHKLEQIYAVTPRVNADGGIIKGNNLAVTFDTDRLYASVDELLLDDPSDTSGAAMPFNKRAAQDIFASDPARLKRLRFFLTAESRAPEITATGAPRVSIWPVNYKWKPEDNKRTSFDNVSAFASTLGKHPYHFRRSGAVSNEDDFSNRYNTPDTDPFGFGMVHNNYLAQYLIQGAKRGGQGYAASMTEKYDGRYNIASGASHNMGTALVAMLEYIRQTNAHDSTHSTKNVSPRVQVDPYGRGSFDWIGTDTLGQVAALDMAHYGTPLNVDNKVLKRNQSDDGNDRVWTAGIGREMTVSEFGLVFILAAENPTSPAAPKVNPDLVTKLKLQPGQKAIQVGVVAEGFCAAQGYSMLAPSTSFNVLELDSLRITTADFGIRRAGGIVTAPRSQPNASNWGKLLHNVSHLQYLCKIKPPESPTPGRNTNGDWWVGWGGSSGYWMFADSDANGKSGVENVSDLDTTADSLSNPAMYSRGYFLVPSHATSMTISSDRKNTSGGLADRCLEIRVGNQRNGDYPDRRLMVEVPSNMVVPVPQKPASLGFTFSRRYKDARSAGGNRFVKPEIIDANDVVRTWVVRHGDYRLAYQRLKEGAGAAGVDAKKRLFVPHPAWDPATLNATELGASRAKPQIHAFLKAGGKPHRTGGATLGTLPAFGNGTVEANLVAGVDYNNVRASPPVSDYRPDFPVNFASPTFRANVPGYYPYSVNPTETRDWDNGTGIAPDGSYWNKPDDGARMYDGNIPPYFSPNPWDGTSQNYKPANQTTAPNQLIPSAVMFGSLSSAPSTGLQWTTFLFRPDITQGGHLGAADHSTKGPMPGAPPDHTLLDWFWMPVVQPYPISEPFSTAGKINMNYRIVPFTNITRATGLHAVLKSEEMLAIPTLAGPTYKDYTKAIPNGNWRHYIDATKTLVQWEDAFNQGRFFKNAGEVCEQFLVPQGQGIGSDSVAAVKSAMKNFWDDHRLTGDNSLERPYANIYPRLTTRSNTFRVHFLAQTISKARSTDPRSFVEGQDTITAERQGDALVERAIDPNDPALMTDDFDYINKARSGTLGSAKSLDTLYTWRIRSIRRFSR